MRQVWVGLLWASCVAGVTAGEIAKAAARQGNAGSPAGWIRLFDGKFTLETVKEADIALSPGFRWGPSLLPGSPITREDLYNTCALTYPNAYRSEMTGETIHTSLEDVADNLFNTDPYYQQGGDMVRVGGMAYAIDVTKPQGSRLTNMTVLKTGEALDAAKTYVVSGWGSINENTEGPAIGDVVEAYIKRKGTITLEPNTSVTVTGI